VFIADAAAGKLFGDGAAQSRVLLRGIRRSGRLGTDDAAGNVHGQQPGRNGSARAVEESYAANNQFFQLMQGYLALGPAIAVRVAD
jgi:HAMP domain-containing protein